MAQTALENHHVLFFMRQHLEMYYLQKDTTMIIKFLRKLSERPMTYDELLTTKIGITVGKLKQDSTEAGDIARSILQKWRKIAEEQIDKDLLAKYPDPCESPRYKVRIHDNITVEDNPVNKGNKCQNNKSVVSKTSGKITKPKKAPMMRKLLRDIKTVLRNK